jgi:predicted acetyltransferase
MAEIAFREPTGKEAEAFWQPTITAFGMHPDPTRIEDWRPILDTGLSVGALDRAEWVGGASALVNDVVLPGGSTLPAALVTMVGVLPTHRRRGVLRGLMERQLDTAATKGLPIAALLASESVIYGRFGYGPATWSAHLEIDTSAAAFDEPPAAPGALRMVSKSEALDPLHDAYARCLPNRPGGVGRDRAFWQHILADPKHDRRGASELFVMVHHDATGTPDGAVTYRLRLDFDPAHNLADGTARIVDLFAVSPEVEAVLWRAMLDVDLVKRVEASSRPLDDPIRWRLVEPRQLRTTGVTDWLWVRVLDVAAALSARTYEASGQLVLEVDDPLRRAVAGRYLLAAEARQATCVRTDADPDVRLPVASLGSLLLGGVAASSLAAAHRLDARDASTLRLADALFRTNHAPHCSTDF